MALESSWTREQAEQYLEQQAQRYAKMREDAERVKQQLAESTATVTSPNGAVTVTVGSGGVMRSLRFGQRAEGLPLAQLSASIMAAYGTACRRAAEQSVEIVSELVGPDSPTLQLMRDAIPPDPDEQEGTR
jgi:DNA-binding protein YbaB